MATPEHATHPTHARGVTLRSTTICGGRTGHQPCCHCSGPWSRRRGSLRTCGRRTPPRACHPHNVRHTHVQRHVTATLRHTATHAWPRCHERRLWDAVDSVSAEFCTTFCGRRGRWWRRREPLRHCAQVMPCNVLSRQRSQTTCRPCGTSRCLARESNSARHTAT